MMFATAFRSRVGLATETFICSSYQPANHSLNYCRHSSRAAHLRHSSWRAPTLSYYSSRSFCTSLSRMAIKALVLGVYEGGDKNALTKAAAVIEKQSAGRLTKSIDILGPIKKGKSRILYDLTPEYPVTAVVGLGSESAGFNEQEMVDEKRQNIRGAVASGARSLRDLGNVENIAIDDCSDAEAAAEGTILGLWYFDELKSAQYKKNVVSVSRLSYEGEAKDASAAWERGSILANGQNFGRRLAEMPANLMTPTIFCNTVNEALSKTGVKVIIHDRAWAEKQKMGSFLSVANGSDEPCKFLELQYNNAPNTKPLLLVGKGITFDTGGISIKPSANMDKMRADMGGAANVVSSILTLAKLNSPVNVIGLTPLTENMPSGKATKPGDVVIARNGKSIQVDNTDAEGRLVLADALSYAHDFDPAAIVDLATLTGAMRIALGAPASGCFTNSTELYKRMEKCSIATGDRVWRLPLFAHYTKEVTDSQLADCLNIGKVPGVGGAATAAAFLKEFVTCPRWMHMDIAGVMEHKDDCAYVAKGMSCRPMRTLVTFAESFFKDPTP